MHYSPFISSLSFPSLPLTVLLMPRGLQTFFSLLTLCYISVCVHSVGVAQLTHPLLKHEMDWKGKEERTYLLLFFPPHISTTQDNILSSFPLKSFQIGYSISHLDPHQSFLTHVQLKTHGCPSRAR